MRRGIALLGVGSLRKGRGMSKTVSVTFPQLKTICDNALGERCHHYDQPEPCYESMCGPIGACTQKRCPVWKRWVANQKRRESK